MKKIFIFLLLNFFVAENLFAQKEDRNWVFGDSIRIDFNNLSNPTVHHANCFNHESNASISNYNGTLLGYLNTQDYWSGQDQYCEIMNRQNNLMENGDSIFQYYSSSDGALFLPMPDDTNKYYFFSMSGNVPLQIFIASSVIDKSFNSGLGKVISKNNILEDSLLESVTAIRHGNGRDWWLLVHKRNSNRFVKFLISPTGISSPTFQNIGSNFSGFWGECAVSSDGSKICWISTDGNLDLFDFNRCDGELSNWTELGTPPYQASSVLIYGCEFSPDSKRLYVSKTFGPPIQTNIFQYSLNANPISNSKTDILQATVGLELAQLELGPDNKIYIAGAQGGNIDSSIFFLSVIETPNDSATSCNLDLYSLFLNGHYSRGGLPNMPQYNLSALDGSACDTLGIDAPNNVAEVISNFDFSIYPNPFTEDFQLSITGAETDAEVSIYNIIGQQQEHLTISRSKSIHQTLSLRNYSAGVYLVSITVNGQRFMRKVVKE